RRACPASADIFVLPLDLEDLPALAAQAATVLERFGAVDIMVHNAGVAVRDRAVNTSLEVHERVLRTNYLGPVAITGALLPSMLARGAGQFVVISSLSGKYGGPQLSAYAAAKHALHGYFESLRAEEHDRGIVVTLIVPGFIRTDITAHAFTGTGGRYGKVLQIYRHAMTPERCARRILRAVAGRRQEVLVGGIEVWTVYLKRWFPGALSVVVRSHPVRLRNRLLGWIPILGRRWRTPTSAQEKKPDR
ncbi:MAG TPA: SDR family NAD(P)-dependent oxidoreductase, partial [Gemmatimonadales bacterium]|nr:SDR family NAD(P)-dependent oxidoreductase [Gemmatimonadales bacterium]